MEPVGRDRPLEKGVGGIETRHHQMPAGEQRSGGLALGCARRPDRPLEKGVQGGLRLYDVVGPVCESSDVWGEGRELPYSKRGDILAIRSTGAYGSVMSSRYNLRDLAPAVFSDDLKLK